MLITLANRNRTPLLCKFIHRLTLLATLLLLCFPWRTMAAEANSTLQKRLSNLENRWGHIQIGGDFNLSAEHFSSLYNKPHSLGLEQNSHLFLDAQVDQNFSLYFLLTQESTFGSTNIPIYLNEVALRYRSPRFLGDLGRFRFTLDPLGLIADHSTIPLEGLAFQTGGDSWYLGGYYSRQLSSYFLNDGASFFFGPSGTNTLRADEEVALRLAFPRASYLAGVTVTRINNGVSRIADQEARKADPNVRISPPAITGVAVDFATQALGGSLQAEAAWYPRFDRDGQQTDTALGWLMTWAKPLPHAGFTAKVWSFPEGFEPFYSIIGAVDSTTSLLIGNSCGLLGEYQKALSPGWEMRTQAGIVTLKNEASQNSTSPDLVFSSRLIKSFSALTSIELGYDWGFQPVEEGAGRYSRLFVSTTALF